MTTINLKNGYYIEVDSLNHTLKQRFQGKTKTGEMKDSDRTCGYFPSVRDAIEKYIKLCRLDVLDGDLDFTLNHYWDEEPDIPRIATGIEHRVDRLKCLGNAVVPQQFYPIFQAIADIERGIIHG